MLARKALAGTAGAPKEYVEDVFSTYLYSGTGSTINIVNGIDLSGDGGLVWTKSRSQTGSPHGIVDTARGRSKTLYANTTGSELTSGSTQDITSFNADGFSIGTEFNLNINNASHTYVSWTFRKAKKFFDVVTYTGNGSNRTISHNLGSTPGWIIVKRTDATAGWPVYHRSIGATKALELQITNAAFDSSSYWNNTEPTSTVFTVGTDSYVNANGGTYVAYLFAHDAGGFGDAGSDSIIKCGSVVGAGNPTEFNLGWEPQWIMVKNASNVQDWWIVDNMRGLVVENAASSKRLHANSSDAETGLNFRPTATGIINGVMTSGDTYIYIAIRRGPMKTPTSGTSVYTPATRTGNGTATTVTSAGFPVDLLLSGSRVGRGFGWGDRLRGTGLTFRSWSTAAEGSDTEGITGFDVMDGVKLGTGSTFGGNYNVNTETYVYNFLRRAPGFFDVVCYTGTGSNTTQTHNLGVVPELIIVKRRDTTGAWDTYSSALSNTEYLVVNTTAAKATGATRWNSTTPTSTVFSLGTSTTTNASGGTYVAYLFASVSGVSKVGSYTGNGSSVTVTTDFQPRFIMVKRTDSTGNWIVGDSARGLVAGNDPYIFLNDYISEDTDEDWVDVSSTGFTVNETSAANANVNTGTYIYLAIA